MKRFINFFMKNDIMPIDDELKKLPKSEVSLEEKVVAPEQIKTLPIVTHLPEYLENKITVQENGIEVSYLGEALNLEFRQGNIIGTVKLTRSARILGERKKITIQLSPLRIKRESVSYYYNHIDWEISSDGAVGLAEVDSSENYSMNYKTSLKYAGNKQRLVLPNELLDEIFYPITKKLEDYITK